ncbi:SMAD/FHA domain-containing protein [Zopfochytrium polystomum]|nr:SMAD/FHA domain-containing protein [Zopfochytrium polystomum]
MFGRALSTEKEKARSGGWILFSSIVVSRNHAQIWSDGGQVFVKDLKSSRGTYLNGVRLSPRKAESHPIPVASGDILQIGKDHFEDTDTTSTDGE